MEFYTVIDRLKAKANPATEQTNPAASDNPIDTMPGNMPLTNRLDKMTPDQAIWAIENGDAWIAYLKEQRADGTPDVSVIEYGEQPVQNGTPVSDADRYKGFCDLIDKVWLGLTDNMKRKTLRHDQIPDWVEILQWAIKALPVGYERQREIMETELKTYQEQLTKPKTKGHVIKML